MNYNYLKSPEAEMWRGCIRQLVRDCQLNQDGIKLGEFHLLIDRTRLIHDISNEWLKEICQMLELPYPKVKKKCLDIIYGRDEYRMKNTGYKGGKRCRG